MADITHLLTLIIGGAIGTVFGNWLAIGRDKRKEFNEIAEEVHLLLTKETFYLLKSNVMVDGLTEIDIEKLRRRISVFKRKGFDLAVIKYKKAKANREKSGAGQVLYKDTKGVVEAIQALQKYANRR